MHPTNHPRQVPSLRGSPYCSSHHTEHTPDKLLSSCRVNLQTCTIEPDSNIPFARGTVLIFSSGGTSVSPNTECISCGEHRLVDMADTEGAAAGQSAATAAHCPHCCLPGAGSRGPVHPCSSRRFCCSGQGSRRCLPAPLQHSVMIISGVLWVLEMGSDPDVGACGLPHIW